MTRSNASHGTDLLCPVMQDLAVLCPPVTFLGNDRPRNLIVFHLSAVSSATRYTAPHWSYSTDDPHVHTLFSLLW
jgi:hypothetical protein